MKSITWNQAFKAFKEQKPFVITASKIHPESIMAMPFCRSERISSFEDPRKAFNKLLNSFSYYNCSDETGNKIKFYQEQ